MSILTLEWGKRYLLFGVTGYSGEDRQTKISQPIGEERKPFLRRTSARNLRIAETQQLVRIQLVYIL